MRVKALFLLATATLLHAGTPALEPMPSVMPEAWLKPLVDIRARYEYADLDGKDPATAFTFRERLGLKTRAWYGLSALVEGEFTEVAGSDYNANAGPLANPHDRANSAIPDPRNAELNQAMLQYVGFDTTAKVGRQRLIYDNAAFIGNVGWRQNEQTFDAISLSNKFIAGLTFNYAYLNQIDRIYGAEADSPLTTKPLFDNVQDIAADVNLFTVSYTGVKGVTLGGYAYIMNFHDKPNWDNDTFGLSAKGDVLGLTLFGELAWQDQAGFNSNDQAWYAHCTASKTFGSQTLVVGVEQLNAGFKTPLATVHVFNGYADAFANGRIEGNHNGLTDVYVSHTLPVFCGINWTNALHAYGDDTLSTGYGWEYDSVLVKKFDEHFTALVKLAMFESEGDAFVGTASLPATTRASMELDYTF
jgi:hypothetical protein